MPEIPAVQKAAWITNPGPDGKLEIRHDVPTPQPGDGEVLVKMECCGLCGSDTRALLGYGPYKSVPGHEGIGTVVSLGPNTPSSLLGTRIGIKWLWSACGTCSLCRRGQENNCPKQLNTGKHVHGTMAEYAVAHARYVTRIPEGVASDVAAPLLCAGLSLMGAVSKLSGLERGDRVVILGAGGGLGHLGVQIAREKGFDVLAVDSGGEKGDLCLSLGAKSYIDISSTPDAEVIQRVRSLTEDEGAHAVIVVPGTEAAFRLAPKLVRNGGTMVGVGLPRLDFMFPIGPTELSARGLTVSGASVGTEAEMEELLVMAGEGRVVPKVEVCGFEDGPGVLERLVRGEVVGRSVVRIP
ncbi:hypothetical protein AJ80_07263 [Polytolypa hystricis UAMH7299]|uniref:Enoyl reductase (ER) domain-containing protein n=1 Tax=Polytolypa hystricis (strain UAMH7299) TaxID=1447883 RepID=A0A2B7XQX1_POLH7|nr:hypothetical protein AJ80_07263 [Polytolypa hystricis UAMH7299]